MGGAFSRSKVGVLSYLHHESAAVKRKETLWGASLLAPLYSIRSLPSLAAVSHEIVLTPRSSTHIIPDDMHLLFIYSGHITATVLDVGTVSFLIERTKRSGARRRSLLHREDSLAVRLRCYAIDREHATEEVMLCRRGGHSGGTYLLRFVASKIRSHEVVVKSLLVTQVDVKAKSRAMALPPIVPSNPRGATWGRFNSLVPIVPKRGSTQHGAGGASPMATSAAVGSTSHHSTNATTPVDPGNVPITEDCASILQSSPYFAGISHTDLTALSDMGTISIVQNDCAVMQEREDGGHEMFVVLAGDLRVCVRDQETKVLKPVATLHSGSCMGEMTLLLRGPRTASVTAITNCMLVSIERSTLLSFLRRHPKVEANLKSVLVTRLLQNAVGKRSVPMFDAFQYDDVMKLVPHFFIEHSVARGTELHVESDDQADGAGTTTATARAAKRRFRIILSGTVEIIPATSGSASEFRQAGYIGELMPGMEAMAPGTRAVASTDCAFLSVHNDLCWGHLTGQAKAEALIRWHQTNCTVDMVLRHPPARQYYLRFLSFEFSDENLLFVIDVQAFKFSPTVAVDAKAIVAEYILESSPKQVNVDAKMRNDIVAALPHVVDEAQNGIFDKAVDEITTLMRKDSFPRFKKTPFFKDMLAAFPALDHQKRTADATTTEGPDADRGEHADIGKRFNHVLDQVFAHRDLRRDLSRTHGIGSSREAFAGIANAIHRSKSSGRER
ncbi:hypothetical protein H310_04444 [Aphanomyces invadans]|uniref:Cyclic nucleotide-binding domain-containing protein n=1 Tax=Aphanomyces invadans TaxID=157072 RepID=A0A024UCS1_9STRA|nr:hypothetical protein H310_04444 [Aphanomyces invadans]ETW04064.1 hypothetical protein H310_04444 [Aphanomyces invadans]|eukprot:XP_008867020.1 hypothetical protein H310_04444 [Aphanomyces invadans]